MSGIVDREVHRTRRVLLRLTGGVAAAMLLLGVPNAASALWSATTTATAALETEVIPAPANVTCTTHPAVIGLLAGYVTISWSPVTVSTGSVSYRVYVGESTTVVASTTGTSVELRAGILESLIPNLLQLLLGGQSMPVRVEAVHSSSWVSQQSEANRPITGSLVNNLLCA